MANDIFGGLIKGITGLMPKDDPDVKILNAQTEYNEYEKQVQHIYSEIGKKAIEKNGLDAYEEYADQLNLAVSNLEAARVKLNKAKEEKVARENEERELLDRCVCPECGLQNSEQTKFCTECGAKLGNIAKVFCKSCGIELEPGTKFCGECGSKQGEL